MSKTNISMSPSDISDKWNRRLKGSVSDIQKGIDAVTVSPMQQAAKKLDKAKANYMAAIDSGRMAKALNAVDFQGWKDTTKKKVGERLSGGVDGAMTKRAAFDSYLVTTLNAVLPKIAAMPDLTLDDSLNRVRTLMEHMSTNRYKK